MSEFFESSINKGCSTLQGPHQEAKTFTKVGFPDSRSKLFNPFNFSDIAGSLKEGTGLPINAEGITFGFKNRPTARKIDSKQNTVIGNKKIKFFFN